MDRSQSRRIIEWGKNVLIVFLALSGVYLISQSTLYDGFGTLAHGSGEALLESSQIGAEETGERHISLQPVRLAVKNQSGCYGTQYDQQTTDLLFKTKMEGLLRDAIKGAKEPVLTSEELWKAVLGGGKIWVYYDFMTNLPLSDISVWLGNGEKNPVLSGTARRFILTKSEGKRLLYYCNEDNGEYYCCELTDGGKEQLESVVNEFSSNGAKFAFEEPESYGTLRYDVMILPAVPNMPKYEVKNPLANLQEGEQEKILRSLLFDPQTVSLYQSVDGLVIREGDTLRIQNNGTITFHSQGEGQVRFPISTDNSESFVEITQKLFMDIVADRCGEGVPYLIGVNKQKDGSAVVSYGYRLNGAPVQVFAQGYAAQFSIKNGRIRDFMIHVRQYNSTDEKTVVLPEKQAAAAMKALGQEGKELLLVYFDSGNELRISANWMAH